MIEILAGAALTAVLQPAAQKFFDWFDNQKALKWPVWKSIADDIQAYFDECEKEISGYADKVQMSAVSSFQWSEEQRKQIEQMFQANRELIGIPDENAEGELTFYKDFFDQLFEPFLNDERFIEYKEGAKVKLNSFISAYKRETLSFVTGKQVNREGLMSEKDRALEFVAEGVTLIEDALKRVSDHLKEVGEILGAQQGAPAIISEADSAMFKEMTDNAFKAFDRMLQKMIDRLG